MLDLFFNSSASDFHLPSHIVMISTYSDENVGRTLQWLEGAPEDLLFLHRKAITSLYNICQKRLRHREPTQSPIANDTLTRAEALPQSDVTNEIDLTADDNLATDDLSHASTTDRDASSGVLPLTIFDQATDNEATSNHKYKSNEPNKTDKSKELTKTPTKKDLQAKLFQTQRQILKTIADFEQHLELEFGRSNDDIIVRLISSDKRRAAGRALAPYASLIMYQRYKEWKKNKTPHAGSQRNFVETYAKESHGCVRYGLKTGQRVEFLEKVCPGLGLMLGSSMARRTPMAVLEEFIPIARVHLKELVQTGRDSKTIQLAFWYLFCKKYEEYRGPRPNLDNRAPRQARIEYSNHQGAVLDSHMMGYADVGHPTIIQNPNLDSHMMGYANFGQPPVVHSRTNVYLENGVTQVKNTGLGDHIMYSYSNNIDDNLNNGFTFGSARFPYINCQA